jgi:hypothetical protein
VADCLCPKPKYYVNSVKGIGNGSATRYYWEKLMFTDTWRTLSGRGDRSFTVKLPQEGLILRSVTPFSAKMSESETPRYMLVSPIADINIPDLKLKAAGSLIFADRREINYCVNTLELKCSFNVIGSLVLDVDLPETECVIATVPRNQAGYTGAYLGLGKGFPRIALKTGGVDFAIVDPERLKKMSSADFDLKSLGKIAKELQGTQGASSPPDFTFIMKTLSNGSIKFYASNGDGEKKLPTKNAKKKPDISKFMCQGVSGWAIVDPEMAFDVRQAPVDVFLGDVDKLGYNGHLDATLIGCNGLVGIDGIYGLYMGMPYPDSFGFRLGGRLSMDLWVFGFNAIGAFDGGLDFGHNVHYLQFDSGLVWGPLTGTARTRGDLDFSPEAQKGTKPSFKLSIIGKMKSSEGDMELLLKTKCFKDGRWVVCYGNDDNEMISSINRHSIAGRSLLADKGQLPLGCGMSNWDAAMGFQGLTWNGHYCIGSVTEEGLRKATFTVWTDPITVTGRHDSGFLSISNFSVPQDNCNNANFLPGRGLVEGAALKGDVSVEFNALNGSTYRIEQKDVIFRVLPDGTVGFDPDQNRLSGCGLSVIKNRNGHPGLKSLAAQKAKNQSQGNPSTLDVEALSIRLFKSGRCSVGISYKESGNSRWTQAQLTISQQ